MEKKMETNKMGHMRFRVRASIVTLIEVPSPTLPEASVSSLDKHPNTFSPFLILPPSFSFLQPLNLVLARFRP